MCTNLDFYKINIIKFIDEKFEKHIVETSSPVGLFKMYEILKRSKSRNSEGNMAFKRKSIHLHDDCDCGVFLHRILHVYFRLPLPQIRNWKIYPINLCQKKK